MDIAVCGQCLRIGAPSRARTAGGLALRCPKCGGDELAAPDSPRAKKILGDDHDRAVKSARIDVVEGRVRTRQGGLRLFVVFALLAGGAGAFLWLRARDRAPNDSGLVVRPPRSAAVGTPAAVPEPLPPYLERGQVRILESGLARGAPDAKSEAVMRVTAGEKYEVAERRDGWIRLRNAPVTAWVPEPTTERLPWGEPGVSGER